MKYRDLTRENMPSRSSCGNFWFPFFKLKSPLLWVTKAKRWPADVQSGSKRPGLYAVVIPPHRSARPNHRGLRSRVGWPQSPRHDWRAFRFDGSVGLRDDFYSLSSSKSAAPKPTSSVRARITDLRIR